MVTNELAGAYLAFATLIQARLFQHISFDIQETSEKEGSFSDDSDRLIVTYLIDALHHYEQLHKHAPPAHRHQVCCVV